MARPSDTTRLQGWPRLRVWMFVLASAPLITFSQPPVNAPLLAFFGLVPLFLALPRLSTGGSWLAGWLVGMAYYWVNTWWLGEMVTDPGKEWIVFGMFAFVATLMALFWGFAAMTTRWLMTRREDWPLWLTPLVWLGFEFMREVPVPYPWLPLGAAITEFELFIQTADVWGQYGLTASVVFVNLAIARTFELSGPGARVVRRKARPMGLLAAGLLFAAGTAYGSWRLAAIDAAETKDGPLIALVQGNLAQEVKVREDPNRIPDSYEEHLRLTREGVQAGAELVCWAETMLFGGATREGLSPADPATSARFFPEGVPARALLNGTMPLPDGRRYNVRYVEHLRAIIAHDLRTPMMVGSITTIPPEEQDVEWKRQTYPFRRYNTAMLFDAQGRTRDTYDKRYMVPGGEYIPLEDFAIFRKIVEHYAEGLQGYTSRVEAGRRLVTFRLPSTAPRLEGREWAFTSSICYEYAWPGCYRELHGQGSRYPDFHVNLSNEGWFKESAELDHAVDFCRLRAIESRVPMVRATNTGITCHIDAAGRVRETLAVDGKDREVQGVLLVRPAVLERPGPTIFVAIVGRALGHFAQWVTLVILAIMAWGRIQRLLARRRAKWAARLPEPEDHPLTPQGFKPV